MDYTLPTTFTLAIDLKTAGSCIEKGHFVYMRFWSCIKFAIICHSLAIVTATEQPMVTSHQPLAVQPMQISCHRVC
jgi:hypothetical protein